MEKTELKPCPFCGGKAEFIRDRVLGLYAVWCKKCKCQTTYQFDFGEGLEVSKRKATEVWNRRADHERKAD
jgi:Lar family restriction alleviation protein